MSKCEGTLLVLKDGKYCRKRLKSLRIHDEWGAVKDFAPGFRGEVVIEEAADGADFSMFKQSLEQPSHKNENKVSATIGVSVLLIILGMAAHHLMMLHWLR